MVKIQLFKVTISALILAVNTRKDCKSFKELIFFQIENVSKRLFELLIIVDIQDQGIFDCAYVPRMLYFKHVAQDLQRCSFKYSDLCQLKNSLHLAGLKSVILCQILRRMF